MPGISPYAGAWIFQRLELESFRRNSSNAAVFKEELAVS